MSKTSLLSRYAEAIYWMGRYVERAENVARILDVNESFSRDARGDQNWRSTLQLFADEERFKARYDEVTPANVINFYMIDDTNPGSIVSAVRAARDNARTLRPLISTEMWTNLNIFYNRVRAVQPGEVSEERLSRLCAQIKESCQTHTGITEGTFYRDEGWFFYEAGRYMERADQTTRLLDVKYLLLLPSPKDVGSVLDTSQWNALLRSAAGYHAFRRIYPSGMQPSRVADFLLFNEAFPRSVALCVEMLNTRVTELKSRYGLRGGSAALEQLDELRAVLDNQSIDDVIAKGLHEFLDGIQVMLNDVSQKLGQDFFGYEKPEQQQSQSAEQAPA